MVKSVRPTYPTDWIRGVACLVMAIYHFCLDLQVFGDHFYLPKPFWRWAAEPIGGAFLICAGVVAGLNSAGILRRARCIGFIALGFSLVSFWVPGFPFPLYFGILHAIAVGLLLTAIIASIESRSIMPWNPARMMMIAAAWIILSTVLLEPVELPFPWFLAFSTSSPEGFRQLDYWPWLPAAGYVFFGYAWAQAAKDWWYQSVKSSWISKLGRHSMAFYLLHQPVILLALYLAGIVRLS